ncbi:MULTISPECIES: Ig-like domain-containing protein [Rhodococcus]|jgi:lipoprotein-anchoring transpeptidase ErfK/SrfK|uniref:Ig-like domain-containing protein n=1 Tax=Rhodococcus cerastii TaxID=908616 RepID=A0ABU4CZ06_9NOCA|nr:MULTISPECIES: Ig-like domain-containing protein [Rhodococcus]KAA0925980.1 L,D-transpeptidase family protein [Rhodococcus sp. ANT_H53B]MDV6302691.1 Ig-like domain-containing protein [Rhodococcus cerastii]MDV8054144.1 Ig-like domain-containing protein [Rhodococcus sp. IEGM 1343]MDV8079682.1 Ig-like domain-containing protein [Rhodococcus sp. IEGM 1370]
MRVYRGFVLAAVGVVASVAVLSGCSSASDVSEPSVPIDSNPMTELMKPKLTSSVLDGAVGFSPADPVTVSVADGKLSSVTMLNPEGVPVSGAISPDGLSWTNTEPLGYDREYRVQADAYGLGGASSTVSSFTTSQPGNFTKPYVLPNPGDVVGIGQPVAVQFDEPITDKVAAQNAITVTTTPAVEGAFYWVNNKEVRWRPQNYWAPGTKVDVAVNVYGRDLGDDIFGQENATTSFTIGDAVIATADDNTKQVTFNVNGQDVITMPTSMGKDSTPTDNGVYIIGDRFEHLVMDSSTYGVPVNSSSGYRTPVDWATRMSYSGIFFHSAPWSVGQQGYSNASHGCLNLSPTNAKWVYDNTKRGDIVVVKNTVGGTLSGTDGLGDWNVPWDEWKAGNATTV